MLNVIAALVAVNRENNMKSKQRGVIGLGIFVVLGVVGLAASLWGPSPGTYSIVSDNGSLIRTDTRTGAMQRCHVAGNRMTCETISAQR